MNKDQIKAIIKSGISGVFYTLDENRKPKIVSPSEWGKCFGEIEKFRVGRARIFSVEVSTVFLCVDHRHSVEGDPILWETMIFGGKYDQYQERYTSEKDAIDGHRKAVRMVLLSPFEKIINWWKNLE